MIPTEFWILVVITTILCGLVGMGCGSNSSIKGAIGLIAFIVYIFLDDYADKILWNQRLIEKGLATHVQTSGKIEYRCQNCGQPDQKEVANDQ